jgi:hypothetical protein
MPRLILRIALLFALSLPALHAQLASNTDLDELAHYTLTMDKLTRVMQTFPDIKTLVKTNPSVASALATNTDKPHTIADVDRRISAYPQLVAVFTQHGLTPHEFIVVELTMVQSAFAFAAKQSGAKLPADNHVNPANIAFVEQHQAEIHDLQKKYPMDGTN